MRGQLDELDVRPLVSLLMPLQTITEAQKRMKECKTIERVTLPLPEESRSSPPVQLKLPIWTGHLCWKGEQGASIYFTEH